MDGKRIDDLLVGTGDCAVRIEIIDSKLPSTVPAFDAEIARQRHVKRPHVQMPGG